MTGFIVGLAIVIGLYFFYLAQWGGAWEIGRRMVGPAFEGRYRAWESAFSLGLLGGVIIASGVGFLIGRLSPGWSGWSGLRCAVAAFLILYLVNTLILAVLHPGGRTFYRGRLIVV